MSKEVLTTEDCFKCGLCCYFPLFKNKELKASPNEKYIIVGADGWCIYFEKETNTEINPPNLIIVIISLLIFCDVIILYYFLIKRSYAK